MITAQHVDWTNIEYLVGKLSENILKLPRTFSSITTLSRGGLIPSRLLADSLGIKTILVDQKMISSNSLFVVLFSPLIGLLWLWMKKKKIEPNYFVKFGMAFLFLGGAFYVFYANRFFADASGKTSLETYTSGM